MAYNGPAVCLSRCYLTQHPATILVPRASGATKLSRCKEGMARVFAVMVQILLSSGAVAVQIGSELRIYPRLQSWLRALAQCRGTKLIGARKLSRCIVVYLRADAGVRVQEPLQICLECRSKS